MDVNIKGRSFLKLLDFTSEEIRYLLDLSKDYKALKRAGIKHKNLEGKNIAILFEKDSTRTRCAFEVGAMDLGMGVTYLGPTGSQMGKKESIADTARVLGRMYDGIEYRGFSQSIVEELADYAGVPVWNGLTDEFHPTQILADLLTIEEKFGLNFTSCAPKELFPSQELVSKCKEIADKNGCTITLTEDVMEGTKNADVIYTDVWVSMGEPDEVWEDRIKQLKPYQVNADIMKNANPQAIFMHCLPSFHDLKTKIGAEMGEKFGITEMEVTNEVFESKKSVVFDEAENRMHTIKAIMAATIGQ